MKTFTTVFALIIAAALVYSLVGVPGAGGTASDNPLVGEPAPGFELPSLDGPDVSSTSLAGSVVLLDFWATTCVPCRQQMPSIERLAETYGRAGFQVVGVNVDYPTEERLDEVRTFLAENDVTYPTLIDDGSAAYNYGAARIPTVVIVDREGRVADVLVGLTGFDRMASVVERLL